MAYTCKTNRVRIVRKYERGSFKCIFVGRARWSRAAGGSSVGTDNGRGDEYAGSIFFMQLRSRASNGTRYSVVLVAQRNLSCRITRPLAQRQIAREVFFVVCVLSAIVAGVGFVRELVSCLPLALCGHLLPFPGRSIHLFFIARLNHLAAVRVAFLKQGRKEIAISVFVEAQFALRWRRVSLGSLDVEKSRGGAIRA